ncbi:DUF5719 family protein [Microbacterium sp. Marseille-Q6648]|uniref:DUF5719 family protein n=1 Tax=Microbacterium sp. Marseille-Q6648 TaxID=2937991 RepID=UPI00203FE1F4|nr:DUF5719 family protein [Microbacterium sp. Marseille-Q6648]
MSEGRGFRWAPTSTRMLAGTVVSAVAVIATVTSISVPWPTLEREPLSVSAVPAPSASVLACTGGLMIIGRDLEDAAGIASATQQSVVSGVVDGAPQPDEVRLVAASVDEGEGPVALTAAPDGRSRTDVAAAGSSSVRADDIAGYAASACRPPLLESWLVGGSGATGAADLVVLANPGSVAATVQITVYGAEGAAVPAGGEAVVVAPGTQRVIPLSGLALGEERPVLRVTAAGAPVQASLQASITRVLEPGGADQVGPVVGPETVQVVEGLRVTAASEAGTDAAGVVRVVSPSRDAVAAVTVTAVGETVAAHSAQDVPLTAGVPTEVALGDLPEGLYTVRIEADAPVVSGAWQVTGFDAGDDFAWYAPAPAVASPSLFAVPAGAPASLVLSNLSDEDIVVTLERIGGDAREVAVPGGGSAAVRLRTQALYLLDPGEASVRAGVSLAEDGALAGYPVWPADAAAPPITVYP